MEIITSPSNKIVKHIKSLHIKKNREKCGEFIASGLRLVREASDVSFFVFSDTIARETKNSVKELDTFQSSKYFVVSDKIFRTLCDTENPQGIMAVVKIPKQQELSSSNSSISESSSKLKFIILDNLQDPGNVGTIIRTASAFGLDGVILSEDCVDVYNPKVVRSSMGSIFHIPLYRDVNIEQCTMSLKNTGCKVYAAHLDGESLTGEPIGDGSRGLSYQSPVLSHNEAGVSLIIGNEANGIRKSITQLADTLVKIPMPGTAESLNASVAAFILMYEMFVKQN